MSDLNFEMTDRVMSEDRVFPPSEETVRDANVTAYMKEKGFSDYEALYQWSIKNPEDFWADMASELPWMKPWDTVMEWTPPYVKWFNGATCNISYACLDRHMTTPRRNKVAYYWEGEDGKTITYTYQDLYRAVNRFSNALAKLGVTKGDRVVLYMPRVMEQIIAMLSVARLGAIHSIVYSGFSHTALADRIQDGEAKLIITADGYYYRNKLVDLKAIVDEAVQTCPSIEHVIYLTRAGNPIHINRERDLPWEVLMDTAGETQPAVEVSSEDPLYMLYTSGTTGRPKGIIHVHGGTMVQTYATTKFVLDLKDNDVYWCTADPGWVTGHSYIVYGPLLNGATSVFYEGSFDIPDAGRWWSIIHKYGVNVWYTTPTAIRALMRFGAGWANKHDLSSLRLLGSVGEPINPGAWSWFREVTGDKDPIMDTWWQTETGGHMITPLPVTPLKPGSATRPFLGIEADVVDRDGNSVPANKGGYLIIRKPWPSLMRTIYKDSERYEKYWNTLKGVYFAGDAAHKDPDGYFWIQGRVDDVIKKSGYRLGTSEIESALVSHPQVAEAAVIGKPDELRGESIKAFVILRSGYPATEALMQELRNHVRSTVGPIASPDEITFVDSLPKTRSGKIMRRVLKAQELGQPVGDLSTLEE